MEPSKTTSILSDYQDLPDGSLPLHIIQRLSAQLQGILKGANITTCRAFLELTFDCVLKFEKTRSKIWSEIKNEKPFILQYLLDLKTNLPLSQKALSDPRLPSHIVKRLSVRLQGVLKDNDITNCRAFLDLKAEVVLGWRKAGSKTWQEIKDEKPYIFQYLHDLKADSHPAQTDLPDRPLPAHIIKSLPVRLQGILRNADINTCNEFLSLEHDFVLSLTNAGRKTWHDIENAKPLVSQYLIDPQESPFPSFKELPDRPLPPYILKCLTVRAQNALNNNGITTCRAFLALGADSDLPNGRNAGLKTWQDIEGMKPDVNRFLREGEFWTIDHQAFDSYESFLSAFLTSFPKITNADIVLDHRLAIRGTGEFKTLDKTASILKATRERIRQIESKVCRLYFEEEGRSLVAPFLKATRDILSGESGAASPDVFIAKIDEMTGWHGSNPSCIINFLWCFGEVVFDSYTQIISLPDFGMDGVTASLRDSFESFCQDEKRVFADLSYECFISHLNSKGFSSQTHVSFEAYQKIGYQLLERQVLPTDKQQQLEAFVTTKTASFSAIGDKRKMTHKILSVLSDAKRPLSQTEWLELSRRRYPNDDVTVNHIRNALHYDEVVNYDRGTFIWHEYVSISDRMRDDIENQVLTHLKRTGVRVVSIFKFFEDNKLRLMAEMPTIPTQTLLYFLLRRNTSGRLEYLDYPRVSAPGFDKRRGDSAFLTVMREDLFRGGGVTLEALKHFYSKVLCADGQLLFVNTEFNKVGNLYYLDAPAILSDNSEQFESVNIKPICDVLRTNFPGGIALSPAADSLLSKSTGLTITPQIRNALQSRMFERQDGIWLLPEQVVDERTAILIQECVETWMRDFGFWQIEALYARFQTRLRNLPEGVSDFRQFYKAIEPSCTSTQFKRDQKEKASLLVVKYLEDAGDCVFEDTLAEHFPNLTVNAFADLALQNPYIIRVKDDEGRKGYKHICAFWLPEDFSDTLVEAIAVIEADGDPVTETTLLVRLHEMVDPAFSDTYAISSDITLRDVVTACYAGDAPRIWRGHNFVPLGEITSNQQNVLDAFLAQYGDVPFHEEDFFEFAMRTRSLSNSVMLILGFLRVKCIRLEQRRWISKEGFLALAVWKEKDKVDIAKLLRTGLKGKAFLPIGLLHASFYERLPSIMFDGNTLEWSPYLLTSICTVFKLPVRVVNDEPSPYIVTAMVVPDEADLDAGIVAYAVKHYRETNGDCSTPLAVFEYLKTNKVRMTATNKLLHLLTKLISERGASDV